MTIQLKLEANNIQCWLEDPRPTIHTILFGTFDELWCNAQFYWISHAECRDYDQAFVHLWRCHLEYSDECELQSADFSVFFNSLEANKGYGSKAILAQLTEELWLKETSEVINGIISEIARVRSGEHLILGKRITIPEGPRDSSRSDTYWGIFEDGRRVGDERAFTFSVPGQFIDGLVIRNEWNDREFFIKTTEAFGLFVWCTGA